MSLPISLPHLWATYRNWVSKNPQFTSDCEVTVKWFSYFLSGKINNSHILSELVYCISNLVVLLNDRIISDSRKIELSKSGDNLKLWLTVLEYCEVFLELSAANVWGNTGKWLIIACIQVFKCVSRLILVYTHKEIIIYNPPIPVLDRANLDKVQDLNSFTLKSSGRVVRKVEASPPMSLRTWKPIQPSLCDNQQTIDQSNHQTIAETVYILKPLTHLTLSAFFGSESWKPWIASLLMDLVSLHLYRSNMSGLSPKQRLQLSRRMTNLILYIIRSPFYDRFSKNHINAFLGAMSRNLPLVRIVCDPLALYLPFWQSNYFYMWST